MPATVPESAIDVEMPDHIACKGGVAVTVGAGLTIIGVFDEALQPLASVTETENVPDAEGRALIITGF